MSDAKGLAAKLEKLRADADRATKKLAEAVAEEKREREFAGVRDEMSAAVLAAIQAAEKSTGKSLKALGLGIWVAFPKDAKRPNISALEVHEDGLPKQLKRAPAKAAADASGNGKATFEYVLADGRVFPDVLAAVAGLGIPESERGKYWHRHDRLPADVAAKITKREMAATAATTGTAAGAAA